jgi:hypothetical protein
MYEKLESYHLHKGNKINAGKLEDSVEGTLPKNEKLG